MARPGQPPRPPDVTDERGSGLRVLLLEDEPANRALVRAIVAAARAILADHDVDVALLDMRLPDGNGLDVAADLRAEGSATRVIIVSASVLPAERTRALASGAHAFLGKPFLAADLIDALLDSSPGGGPEPGATAASC
jgi:two-component system response regulator DesR